MITKAQGVKKPSSAKLSNTIDSYRQEIKKVKWCSKEEVLKKARLVIVSSFVMGFVIYGTDLVIRGLVDGAHWIFKLIF